MGPVGPGPRCGTEGLGQHKTHGITQHIRAKRGQARTLTKCPLLAWFCKNQNFYLVLKTDFLNCFSKCSHLKTIRLKFMKTTANSYKYPKFSCSEKSSLKYWAISEVYKFEMLAPCGRHANKIILPYFLDCPCLTLWILETVHNCMLKWIRVSGIFITILTSYSSPAMYHVGK